MLHHPGESRFESPKGPILAYFLLEDEINCAPAKVQPALLEAMEERQITCGDVSHKLSWLFLVVATQNPVEYGGAWDLLQVQLDRFLLLVMVDYPSMDRELDIQELALEEAAELDFAPTSQLTSADLRAAQTEVHESYLSEAVRR